MKHFIFIATIIIFALLQATILNYVNIFNAKPDLLLISVIIASLFFKPRWAISLSIFSGVLKDIFSVNVFGINTILFFLWSLLIIKLSREISFDSNYVRLVFIFIIAILNNIITRLIFLFLGNFISLGLFLRITFIGSLYTALIFPLALKFAQTLSISEPRTFGHIQKP
jgi:rod shape-determining protein MreD